MTLTADHLRSVLHYDPETGIFTWRKGRQGTRLNRTAGAAHKATGYVKICIDYKLYSAHRLAWLYMTGEWPAEQVDHINTIRHDNRWCNLRAANQSEQNANRSPDRRSTTGYKGVTFHKRAGKYLAQIGHNGKNHYLGLFADPAEAAKARAEKARELHGEFAKD